MKRYIFYDKHNHTRTKIKKTILIIILVLLLALIIFGIYTLVKINENAHETATSYTKSLYFPTYPNPNFTGKTPEQIALINKGEYLVKAGDCIACHTNSSTKDVPAFSGGLPMQTPYGVLYTPNITPDKETGIGNWTEDQFIKAMREGIAPTGEYYYPAFPFLYFNQITTDDLIAIKAYLDNIPAVKQKNRENDMLFPFNWRFLQLGWRLLFFNEYNTGPFKPDPKQSAEWNQGAYLVEGLGHCAMCHTPSHYILNEKFSLAAPIRKYNLTGANVQGYLAPNITKSNLGAIKDSDLLKVFTDYHSIGGGTVGGPMLEAIHDSLIHLKTSDLLAMITYLKSVHSELPALPTIGKNSVGQSIYNNYCSGCHGLGVANATKFGDAEAWGFLARSGMNKLYSIAINGGGNMPAKGTCLRCSHNDIKQAVDYMVLSSLHGHEPTITSKLSMADGERIYQSNCSSCHSSGNKAIPQLGDKEAWKSIEDKGFLQAYRTVALGRNGHPLRGNCSACSDEELLAAVKFVMQKGSTNRNYILW